MAQQGGKHPDAKALKGYNGAGVIEIVVDFRTDTYRTIYTVSCPNVIFVLHAFKKKSRSRSATPKGDMELIKKRYQQALNTCKSSSAELTHLIAEYETAMRAYQARLTLRADVNQRQLS